MFVMWHQEHLAIGESDPTKETEILQSIDENYYKDASFDTSQYELQVCTLTAHLHRSRMSAWNFS